MNCENCGAPLRLVRGRDYFVCDYCTTFYFPTAESPDGVNVLGGEVEGVECPVCDQALSTAAIEGVPVLHCPTCRGVLADQAGFYQIVKLKRAQATDSPRQAQPLHPEDLKRRICCPRCGGPMDTHPYYGPGNVVIDTCGRCALIWLDYGEVAVIADAPGRDRGKWR